MLLRFNCMEYKKYLKERHDSACRSYLSQGYFLRFDVEIGDVMKKGCFMAAFKHTLNGNFLTLKTYKGRMLVFKNSKLVADEPLKLPQKTIANPC